MPRWFPYLGVVTISKSGLKALDLPPDKIWKGFAFVWFNTAYIFSVWSKDAP